MRPSRIPTVLVVVLLLMLLVPASGIAQGPAASAAPGGPVHGEPPTVGPMPGPGSPVPDFIPVAAREGDGVAGYIATRDMPQDGTHPWWYQEPPIPVYADDLHTLVGFMYQGKGFVPVGIDPATVPDFDSVAAPLGPPSPVVPALVLLVRSADPSTAWFEVLPATDPAQAVGFDAMTGVACLSFPLGSRLAMLDRSPADPAARAVRTLVVADGDGTTTAWVDITAEGAVTTGTGTPAWWLDDHPCGPVAP